MSNVALDYLRAQEWSRGNGQCPDCHGMGPMMQSFYPHRTEIHGHDTDCKLSAAIAALSHAAGQDGEQFRAASEEDAYVIEQMGRLLAEIAVIVNGPEPAMTRWSYHDLPEKVRALQERRGVAPEIPFLATPMTDHSECSRLRFEYEKGWNDCREIALRALSRGVQEGK